LGLLLRRAHNRAATELVAVIRPHGLELRHFAMLIVLVDRGPTLQRDLFEATDLKRPPSAARSTIYRSRVW
jgi:MarR family transcriptional regulator, lower aerobic nicotinate degradation pathway regulator